MPIREEEEITARSHTAPSKNKNRIVTRHVMLASKDAQIDSSLVMLAMHKATLHQAKKGRVTRHACKQ
jgi:hypothetical protein